MAKQFKFKLEAVLKIRKLKEEQCKMEIGRIQVRIKQLKGFMQDSNDSIDAAYSDQEKSLGSGVSGRELQFHPYFVSGKKANIAVIEKEMTMLEEQLAYRFKELNQLRGDVKLVEEMKTKEHTKFKKEKTKKEFEQIEEQVQNWKAALK